MMRFVKQTRCSCKGWGVVYEDDKGYCFHCFHCGKHLKQVHPSLFVDSVREAFLAILKRMRPEEDIEARIPRTANWRDLQITILGLIDVQNLENERFRKFFRENHREDELQLSFYHLMKVNNN